MLNHLFLRFDVNFEFTAESPAVPYVSTARSTSKESIL